MIIPENTSLKPGFFNGMSEAYRRKIGEDVAWSDGMRMVCDNLTKSLAGKIPHFTAVYVVLDGKRYLVCAGCIIDLNLFPSPYDFENIAEWARGVAAILDVFISKVLEPGCYTVTSCNDLARHLKRLNAELEDLRKTSALLSRQCAAFCDAADDCASCCYPCQHGGHTPRNWREISIAENVDLDRLNSYEK